MEKIHKTSPDDSAMPNQEHDGLTKREYYSGQILQALLSNPSIEVRRISDVITDTMTYTDALIEALNKSDNG